MSVHPFKQLRQQLRKQIKQAAATKDKKAVYELLHKYRPLALEVKLRQKLEAM